jgi:predicted RNA-binding protein with PUA-like domain
MSKKSKVGGWLFKEEPSHYSYSDLERDGETIWDGVENALALKNLKKVKAGDRVLFYHTGKERAVVGEMEVVAGSGPDKGGNKEPNLVRVKPLRRWPRAVTLDEIKKDGRFEGWDLLRISRLSVVPVSPEQWEWLEELGGPGRPQGP